MLKVYRFRATKKFKGFLAAAQPASEYPKSTKSQTPEGWTFHLLLLLLDTFPFSFLSSSSFQHQSNSSSQNVLLSFLPSFNGIIDGDTNFMFRGTTPAKHYKLSSLNCCCCSVYYHRILLLDVYKYSLSRLLPPTPPEACRVLTFSDDDSRASNYCQLRFLFFSLSFFLQIIYRRAKTIA